LPQTPADSPSATAPDDGVGTDKRRFLHPSNARAFVLQVGALAGAVLSIVAVVKLVLHSDGGPSGHAVPHVSRHVALSLARQSVRVTTLRDYLRSIGANPSPKPSPALDVRGFTAPYTLTTRGYKRGTILVRFEVWRQTTGGERYAVPPTWDRVDVDRDPDFCTCASTFIKLPQGEGRYKLVIGVFPPGTRESNPGNPLKSVETQFRNSV
jgi:hypothetical protein